jgi:hypothetical protein
MLPVDLELRETFSVAAPRESTFMTIEPRRAAVLAAGTALIAATLGGCMATADMSYGEYQFSPGYGSERVYERRVYADTSQGLGTEECRTVVRRHMNRFGEVVRRERQVCDAAPSYPDEF